MWNSRGGKISSASAVMTTSELTSFEARPDPGLKSIPDLVHDNSFEMHIEQLSTEDFRLLHRVIKNCFDNLSKPEKFC